MARVMMSVGDMQVWITPVPGSVQNELVAMMLPAGHPLTAGDHEIGFYEMGTQGHIDNAVTKICGENEAMTLLGHWLLVDEDEHAEEARKVLTAAFPNSTDWLLP